MAGNKEAGSFTIKLESYLNQFDESIKSISNATPKNKSKQQRLAQEYPGRVDAIRRQLSKGNLSIGEVQNVINNLSSLDRIFREVIGNLKNTSDAIKKIQNELDSAQTQLDKYYTQRDNLAGRYNKSTGRMTPYKKNFESRVLKEYQDKNGPQGRNGTYLKSISDKLRNNENFSAFYNTRLKEEENALTSEYDTLTKAIEDTKTVIAKLNAKYREELNNANPDYANDINKGNLALKNAMDAANKHKYNLRNDNPADLASAIDRTNLSLAKQQSQLSKAFKAFTIYATALRLVKQAAREAVTTITELDKSLTEQAMVTGHTREETYQLISQYQELANQVGATTKEIASVATEYMKQGQTIEDSLVLTQAAVSAAKVARVSVGDSVNYLTTALNGFQLAAEDAMRVSDIFASVAAASASDYDELAIALSKVASQANLAGMSIEYTTALLTKGLETTREAPETMGTALKTIIARMRELTDYGATLEGDTDINTVESQLAYVGIDLRTVNGELRSTEDVLDDLGRKWQTLNTNQQAALAKALAGTRQQSRLIALMDGYERVIELQDIAERSAGATAAQASVYLQGIEAAINKIRVAWERVIASFTKSDIITNILSFMGDLLDSFASALQNSITMGAVITSIVIAMMQMVQMRMLENKIAKENYKLTLMQNAAENEKLIDSLQRLAAEKQITEEQKQQLQIALNSRAYYNKQLSKPSIGGMAAKGGSLLGKVGGIGSKIGGVISKVAGAAGWVGMAIQAVTVLWTVGSTVFEYFKKNANTVENNARKVNELSNEIYTLNERSTAIQTAIDKFDELDQKLIKTKEDAEAMGDALSSAADKLTDAQKEAYNSFSTDSKRRQYLDTVLEETEAEAEKKRQEQLRIFQKEYATRGPNSEMFTGTSSDVIQAQDALYAINNNTLYKTIDSIEALSTTEAAAFRELAQSIFENVDALTAFEYATNGTVESLTKTLAGTGRITTSSGAKVTAASILTSDDYTLKDRVEAFRQISSALQTDAEALAAFQAQYSSYAVFAEMTDDVLDFIDKVGLTVDDLNELYAAAEDLRKAGVEITDEQYQARFQELLSVLTDSNGDIAHAIETVFGDYLNQFIEGSDEYIDAYNAFINAYGDLVAQGMLNMGQNLEALENQIGNFYEKAADWGSMSESEKTEFIQDNADLFSGPEGRKLLSAFENGNYAAIQSALMGNTALQDLVNRRRQEIEQELQIELARQGDARNEAYIKYLEDYLNYLDDEENLFAASLETRLEQEENALDEFKSLLEEQQDALTESLEKRRSAYEKYFEDVNATAEREEYEDKASMLIANLGKLGSSTNASALAQSKDLQQQLAELEADRLQTLREEAQQKVLDNMDNTIDQINEKFDKLLENNQALLAVMTAGMENPQQFISTLLSSKANSGATSLELQSYLQNLQSVFGPFLGGIDWSSFNAAGYGTTNNNAVINLPTRTINGSQSMADWLWAGLIKAGYTGI